MKKNILLAILLFTSLLAGAQQEGNIWAFGLGAGLDFTNGAPVAIPTSSAHAEGCASISDENGQLLFYSDGDRIYNSTHQIMPNGVLFYGQPYPLFGAGPIWSSTQSCVILPFPGNDDKYYVFSLGSLFYGYLWYSVVDMTLNGGLGDVVPGQKNILINNGPLAEKMTVVSGNSCNAWVVVRTKDGSQYLSYSVTPDGINTTPVVSAVAEKSSGIGVIKFSPDRQKMVSASYGDDDLKGGLTLYTFNPALGTLNLDARLDTAGSFYGACFSPDNSKLYVTTVTSQVGMGISGTGIFQFNLALPTTTAVIQSRTWLGDAYSDLKTGPDGKIYFLNFFSAGVINFPDLPGILCMTIPSAIPLVSGTYGHYGLPNEVVIVKDTTTARRYDVLACFRDSVILKGNTGGQSFLWGDGSTADQLTVYNSGTYTVRYQTGCKDLTDTFVVTLEKMPLITADSVCPGTGTGKAGAVARDNTAYTYTWKDAEGSNISVKLSSTGDMVSNLNEGNYSVKLNSVSGCDTTVSFIIHTYPNPELSVTPENKKIRYGDSIRLSAEGAMYYVWWPSGPLDSATKPDPVARPLHPTIFTLMGMNEYGCRDTAYVNIDIDYTMPDFIPNAFSPNGDGVNDVFRIENITYQKLVEFRIFNRWGKQVFEVSDPAKGWDGTQDNKPSDIGTYYYLVRLNYPDGTTKTFKGDVVLIR
jgi:gliding motility-associated-like protein